MMTVQPVEPATKMWERSVEDLCLTLFSVCASLKYKVMTNAEFSYCDMAIIGGASLALDEIEEELEERNDGTD